MKQFLWNLIKKHFQAEIKACVESHKKCHFNELSQIESVRKTLINYPLQTKVIVRSNEPQPLFIGKVVGHQAMRNGKLLLVIEDSSGKQIMPLDNEPPYWSQEREDALSKLDWAEQWNAMSKYDYQIDAETKARKESKEYKERK